LGGALATINALPGVTPIVHGAQGCGGNLFVAAFSGSGYFGSGCYGGNTVPSSNVLEKDIVFGGVSRLEEEITTTFEVVDAQLYIVVTSCMTEIIGDDIKGVVASFNSEKKNPPLFYIETAGFSGDSYLGYERVIEGLFEHYIERSEKKDPELVNIFGIIPSYDPFFRGELEEIKRILEALGLKVNTFFTPDQTIDNVKNAGAAALNLSFSPIYGAEQLQVIEKTHGIPWASLDLPVGAQATLSFIDLIVKTLKLNKKTADALKAREVARYYNYIDHAMDIYADSDFQRYAILVSNVNRAIPYAKYLIDEIGWIGKYVFVTDELDEDQKKAFEKRFAAQKFSTKPQLIFETNTDRIIRRFTKEQRPFVSDRYYDAFSPAFILGSSLEKDFAKTINANLLSVSFPITNRLIASKGYAGFNGGLTLFEDLIGTFVAPR
jgi:nitrogenase molybdenum-iron protein beta chain